MKIIRSQGEAQTTLVVRGARADLTSPVTNHKTAPCYLDLPPDVRNQILTEVINAARGDFGEVKPGNPGSTMALVSKVWQHDVEQILFGEISIDPADTQQVAMFKKVFIDERKKYLKRLDIDITNHDKDEGQEKSLVRAAKAMARIGQFLTYINGWDFGKRSLEIVFKTFDLPKDRMVLEPKDKQRLVPINSPLDEYHLDIATKGGNPADMPLRAISQEFPMSLDMVTHLSITPDILPSLAVKKILQTMPNLQTCFLNIRFPADCSASWQVFSDFIQHLCTSSPSLRNLMLRHAHHYPAANLVDGLRRNMVNFSAALRQYSQVLNSLRANPFELDREFFLPFSSRIEELDSTESRWDTIWAWPWLEHLDLQFYDDYGEGTPSDDEESSDEESSSDEDASESESKRKRDERDELGLAPAQILIAAGRAAKFMPNLKSVHISVRSKTAGGRYPAIFLKRKLPPRPGTHTSRVWVYGLSTPEALEVMDAWDHVIGYLPQYVVDIASEFYDPPDISAGCQ